MKKQPKKNNNPQVQQRGVSGSPGEILSLREAMNNLINESFWDPFGSSFSAVDMMPAVSDAGFPKVDISENKKSITITAEIPGVAPEDVDVEIDGSTVTISGETKNEQEENKDTFYRYERHYGSFSRSFVLPSTVDSESAEADVEDGVLTIVFPKKNLTPKKKVTVKKKSSSTKKKK